jgi:phage baseplate assembly protein W
MLNQSQETAYAYRRDIPWDLTLGDNGDLQMLIDVDAVNQSIKNILLTAIGSVPMESLRGSYLPMVLFENTSPINFLQSDITSKVTQALTTQEPSITIKNISVDVTKINDNAITILIEYTLNDGITTGVFNDTLSINSNVTSYRSN